MKRQIADEHVTKIKEMLTQNYKAVSIKDIMKQKYGVTISTDNIHIIKKLKAYKDVRPDLNNVLRAAYPIRTRLDTELISELKCALALGFSINEILKNYNVSKTMLQNIRYGHMPYYSIAPEYNAQIKKQLKYRKKANIDKKMVLAIKKDFINAGGKIPLSRIAKNHNIDAATVSTILNFKCYKNIGIHLNSKINTIKKKNNAAVEAKKKLKLKINNEKKNIQLLHEKKKQIEDQIKLSNSKIKNLRA